MQPQQAGEISMRMHSGEQKQPLPCQVPAISFGESSLGRSCPWLMGARSQRTNSRGGAARSRGRVRAGELSRELRVCDRNVEVVTPAAKLIERIGGKKGATSPALSPLQPTPEELLERARLTPAPVHYPLAQGEATGEDGRLARGRVASLA